MGLLAMMPRQRLISCIIVVSAIVLLLISFSFTIHYNTYNSYTIDQTIFQIGPKNVLDQLSDKSLSRQKIKSLLEDTLSKYDNQSIANRSFLGRDTFRQGGMINLREKFGDEQILRDVGDRLEGKEDKLPVKHFILNDTVNPIYESGRCVIRVHMFMLRKMINRIGKHEGTYHCPELNCDYEITYSTTYQSLADKHIVILFLRTKWEWADLHAARPPNQIWVMYARESPSYDHCIVPEDQWYNTSYNWTMTYHEDAHFPVPYGRYISGKPMVPMDDNRNWAEGKDKFSSWMASNCYISTYPRMKIIEKLSKHFEIDTFGKCGDMSCPKSEPEECGKTLSRYKFYFSLENAECDQYITEKFWRNAYSNNMIPIAYGAPKRDYQRFAPPNSFIYLGDFRNYRKLKDYLFEIDRNDTLFNSFFTWKKHGSIELINFQTIFSDPSVCKLLAKYLEIRQKDPVDVPDTMPDLRTWWKDTCQGNANITRLINSS